MTLIMETLDGGEINTGFHWDKSKIELGELPLMSTQQFIGYVALTLTQEIIPKLNVEERAEWSGKLRSSHEKLESLPDLVRSDKYFAMSYDELMDLLETAGEDEQVEIGDAIIASVSTKIPVEYYAENPFWVQGDGRRVGFVYDGELKHVVDAKDFFILANFVLYGGWKGWSKYGAYREVKDAVRQLNDALSDVSSVVGD